MHMLKRYSGFTLVELLVVIVVIGILTGIVVASYRGYQERAKHERGKQNVQELVSAIKLARVNAGGKTLGEITGSSWSSYACYAGSDGGGNSGDQEPRLLDPEGSCWTNYRNVLDTVSSASGVNLSALKNGDPFGNPYYIDENEGELSWAPCIRDTISMYRPGAALIYERMPDRSEWRPSVYGPIPDGLDPYRVEVYIPMIKPGDSC